jgi:hypothetical protein
MGTHRTMYSIKTKYIFFRAHENFSKIDLMFSHKANSQEMSKDQNDNMFPTTVELN